MTAKLCISAVAYANWVPCGLSFELRQDRQQNARPARWKMRQPTARAWHFDVGPRLERGVRLHR